MVSTVADLDNAVQSATDKLLVIDYSTTWCGPCKLIYPKFEELSEKYPNVLFYKCIGDKSDEAGAVMKREGIRSVPAFHFWKNGSRQEVVMGARIDDIEAALRSYL